LSLPTRQFTGAATAQPRQCNQLQRLLGAAVTLRLVDTAYHQAIGDIVEHVQMRKQGVVLEHGVDVAAKRRYALGGFAEYFDVPDSRLFEPGDQPQTGSLTRAGGSEHGEKFAF
jgi:hypothetical protein